MLFVFLGFAAFAFKASAQCPQGFFDGTYIYDDSDASRVNEDGTIVDNRWETFTFFENERPAGGDFKENEDFGILKNKPLTLKQIGCEELEVVYHTLPNPYRSPLRIDQILKNRTTITISALRLVDMGFDKVSTDWGSEKVTWDIDSLTIQSTKMGNFMGYRKYLIKVEKNLNGDLTFKTKVTGKDISPLPLPATWTSHFKLRRI